MKKWNKAYSRILKCEVISGTLSKIGLQFKRVLYVYVSSTKVTYQNSYDSGLLCFIVL